jgi:hypothetical protein
MRPFHLLPTFSIFCALLLLSACGGGGGSDTTAAPPNTDCVLGTSKIGECTI